jgi:hypothetical protein
VIVEFSSNTQALLNARLTRRLIQLELAEAKLTAHPKREEAGLALFYRLILTDTGELRIELWERGEFYGARRVSTAHGDQKLLARHVALATAELAQRLSRAHSQKAKELALRKRQLLDAKRAREEAAKRERWALVSRAEAAWLAESDAWFAGPRLGFQLNRASRGRLEITAGWLLGSSGASLDGNGAEWLELELAPAYRFDAIDVAAGFNLAAATVVFTGPVSVDGIAKQRQTWSSRAGAHLHYQPALSSRLRLHVGAQAAYLLRDIQVLRLETSTKRLGGLWLGLNLGVLIGS